MVDAIIISRGVFQRIKNYLVYRVAVTFQLLMFFFICILAFRPKNYPAFQDEDDLPDYFNLPVVSLVIIVILNDFAIISIAYDHVIPSAIPEKWNLLVVFSVAVWLGIVAVIAQMLLLDMLFENQGFFEGVDYGEVMMMVWLAVSLLDFFSVFTARVANGFFFERGVGRPLLAAAVFALIVSTTLSMNWPLNNSKGPDMKNLSAGKVAFVWAYCVSWALVQDFTKVCLYKGLLLFNVQGIRTDIELNERRTRELASRGVIDKEDAQHHYAQHHEDNGTEHLLGVDQV